MDRQEDFLAMINDDISRIEIELKDGTKESRWKLFRELDSKYQACILDFYKGMHCYTKIKNELHYSMLSDHPEYVEENLKIVMAKLKTYRFKGNASQPTHSPVTQVNIHNTVNVEMTFERARTIVDDMSSLTDEETAEILERINLLENIIKSGDKKKSKWEKAKSTLLWLANKSFDVGMTFLPLLLKLGE